MSLTGTILDAASFLFTAAVVLGVFTVVIFVHELGHFWVARRIGVAVTVFSIGFGNELVGWTDRLGTRWRLSMIPVGGYVKFRSREDDEADDDGGRDVAPAHLVQGSDFEDKGPWARAWVTVAGPAANFIFGILMLTVLYSAVGQPMIPAVVGNVRDDSAAAVAGIQRDDEIIEFGGIPIHTFDELRQAVQTTGTRPTEVVLNRDGETMTLQVTPTVMPEASGDAAAPESSAGRPAMLGVEAKREAVIYQREGVLPALASATTYVGHLCVSIVHTLAGLISGSVSANDVGGPLLIAKVSADAAQSGLKEVLFLLVLLSVNIGFLNLLPIPVLDGGNLVFCIWEILARRKPSERVRGMAARVGLVVILSLLVLVTVKDVVQFAGF